MFLYSSILLWVYSLSGKLLLLGIEGHIQCCEYYCNSKKPKIKRSNHIKFVAIKYKHHSLVE